MTTTTDALIAAFPLPVLLIGPDQRISTLNEAAQTIFGTHCLGRHYITALRQPSILDAIEATFARGEPQQTRYLGNEDGRATTYRANCAPVSLANEGDRERRGVLVTMQDTTELESAGQMRRDFVANVSHELRTPLTALLGFIETLRASARNDPAARDRFLEIMETEASRMNRLIEDLLSLSRVESEERQRPTDSVNLSALVEEAIRSLTPAAEARNVTILSDMPDLPATVPGDMDQLRQVLNNLIENAIKYGGDGGHVTISLARIAYEPRLRGPAIRVDVQDNGPGIAEAHLGRLTERFFRVDSHRSREMGGTGLGLAIVKHIVNRHRGRLRIESKQGVGSCFTVLLPAE